jgi:3',5'-cyclic AMP phosphodiesterase CpdA
MAPWFRYTPRMTEATTVRRLVVLGDLHLYRLWVAPWRLLSKRLLGQINLWWDRRHKFDPALLRPTLRHAADLKPDLMLLTGDVTMTSMPEEFDMLSEALKAEVGATLPIIALPGNHYRYTPLSKVRRVMERQLPGLVPQAFPLWRPLSPRWRLLALDAARPRLLSARGRVAAEQLAKAAELLRDLSPQQGVIVMCHYPAIDRPDGKSTPWQHRLANREQVLEVLRQCKATIIYAHGHVHTPWLLHNPASGLEQMIDLNVGAPIMRRPHFPHGQGFWQIDLTDDPAQPAALTQHVPIAVRAEADGCVGIDWETRRVS